MQPYCHHYIVLRDRSGIGRLSDVTWVFHHPFIIRHSGLQVLLNHQTLSMVRREFPRIFEAIQKDFRNNPLYWRVTEMCGLWAGPSDLISVNPSPWDEPSNKSLVTWSWKKGKKGNTTASNAGGVSHIGIKPSHRFSNLFKRGALQGIDLSLFSISISRVYLQAALSLPQNQSHSSPFNR